MKRSTPRLSEVARHVVVPADVVSTGWPAVRDKCRDLDITFRWWQHPVGQIILAKRADGKYASTIGGTGLSIPRQVGKTFLVGAIAFALCLLCPGMTVIWTAHRLRTSEETFGKMRVFVKRAKIAPHVERVVLGSGEEAILFANGSRILFGARESGFGLGFDEVDMLIFDEAQRLRDMTLDDMIPATNQSRQSAGALLLFMGTPPRPTDSGEVFTRMRTEVLTGEDSDTGWVEFGADQGFTPTPPPALLSEADWRQVGKANPSYPDDTPREAILRMRKKLGPDSFLREGLGRWDDPETEEESWQLTLEEWRLTEQQVPKPAGVPAFFITAADHLRSVTIAVAAQGQDFPHVEVSDHRAGSAWLTARVKELKATYPAAKFATYHAGPLRAWVPDLAREGVELELFTQPQSAAACAHLKRLVESKEFTHSDNFEVVNKSIPETEWRALDGNAWVVDWKKSPGNAAPIAAMIGALWLLESAPAAPFFASRR